jgi:hypothetical protein
MKFITHENAEFLKKASKGELPKIEQYMGLLRELVDIFPEGIEEDLAALPGAEECLHRIALFDSNFHSLVQNLIAASKSFVEIAELRPRMPVMEYPDVKEFSTKAYLIACQYVFSNPEDWKQEGRNLYNTQEFTKITDIVSQIAYYDPRPDEQCYTNMYPFNAGIISLIHNCKSNRKALEAFINAEFPAVTVSNRSAKSEKKKSKGGAKKKVLQKGNDVLRRFLENDDVHFKGINTAYFQEFADSNGMEIFHILKEIQPKFQALFIEFLYQLYSFLSARSQSESHCNAIDRLDILFPRETQARILYCAQQLQILNMDCIKVLQVHMEKSISKAKEKQHHAAAKQATAERKQAQKGARKAREAASKAVAKESAAARKAAAEKRAEASAAQQQASSGLVGAIPAEKKLERKEEELSLGQACKAVCGLHKGEISLSEKDIYAQFREKYKQNPTLQAVAEYTVKLELRRQVRLHNVEIEKANNRRQAKIVQQAAARVSKHAAHYIAVAASIAQQAASAASSAVARAEVAIAGTIARADAASIAQQAASAAENAVSEAEAAIAEARLRAAAAKARGREFTDPDQQGIDLRRLALKRAYALESRKRYIAAAAVTDSGQPVEIDLRKLAVRNAFKQKLRAMVDGRSDIDLAKAREKYRSPEVAYLKRRAKTADDIPILPSLGITEVSPEKYFEEPSPRELESGRNIVGVRYDEAKQAFAVILRKKKEMQEYLHAALRKPRQLIDASVDTDAAELGKRGVDSPPKMPILARAFSTPLRCEFDPIRVEVGRENIEDSPVRANAHPSIFGARKQ